MRYRHRICVICATLGVLAFVTENRAVAAGTSFNLRGHDLQILVDARWAGNANGGYYPIRIRVLNRGPLRVLTFRFQPRHAPLPEVVRTLSVQQNATVKFTLSIPMVSAGNSGRIQIEQDGAVLKEPPLAADINLPASDSGGGARPGLLVISPASLDCEPFEEAVTNISSGPATGHRRYYGGVNTEDHEIVDPNMLPDSWIDYSGLDIVALSLKTLNELTLENRAALLKWVETGGTLLVFEVGGPAQADVSLNESVGFPNHSYSGARWLACDPRKRVSIPIVNRDQYGNVIPQAKTAANTQTTGQKEIFVWKATSDTFAQRQLMKGRVYAFEENPFPGSPHDWAWFLNSLGADRYLWTNRHGIAARQDSDEFLQFLIPGIQGVPVAAFVILITLFTIVIGPLNYFLLVRRKQLYMLLVTIPVLAVATSACLFGYSITAHGFGIKSRTRSLTVLDQKAQTAVATSRIALYAGLAPSKGLRFTDKTAVYPIWPNSQGFEAGDLDWTQTQALTSGWLRSRTRTQFLTMSHRVERGRLEVQAPTSGRLPISNGLEWKLDALLVASETSDLYFGSEIPPGSSTTLLPATEEKRNAVSHLLKQYPLDMPPDISNPNSLNAFGNLRARWSRRGRVPIYFANSMMEQSIQKLQSVDSKTSILARRSYLAVLEQSPGIQLGVDRTTPKNNLHILLGYY